MIKFKLNPLKTEHEIIEIPNTILVRELINQVFGRYDHKELLLNHAVICIDGKILEECFWDSISVDNDSDVLITLRLRGGDFGQTFKMVAILAIVAVASAYLGPAGAGLSGFAYAGAMVAVTIGTTLAMNALIPPPQAGVESIGVSGYEDSQMFYLTNQSNQIKKYGNVPRAYGYYRMFPMLAAKPYIEFKPNSSGVLDQYLVAVYDFGIGPNLITDMRIGETAMDNFTGIEYNLVDLNKPSTDEGPWDAALQDNFSIYKGIVDTAIYSVAINEDKVDGGDPTGYLVERALPVASGPNPVYEITLVTPRGLYSMNTSGTIGTNSIILSVEFADVDSEAWKPLHKAPYLDMLGPIDFQFTSVSCNLMDYSIGGTANSPTYGNLTRLSLDGGPSKGFGTATFGIKKGDSYIYIPNSYGNLNARLLYLGYQKVGFIYTTTAPLPDGSRKYYFAKEGVPFPPPIQPYSGPDISLVKLLYISRSGVGSWSISSKTGVGNTTLRFIARSPNNQLQILSSNRTPEYNLIKFKSGNANAQKIRITRLNTSEQVGYTFQLVSDLTLTSLVTRADGIPISTRKRHTFLEMRIKATDQLNGTVSNLSGIVQSVLDTTTDGITWTKAVTNNPAWVYVDLLTGSMNRRAISKSRLHIPSILEFKSFCDVVPTAGPTQEPFNRVRYESNFILDYNTTLNNIIGSVLGACQASLNLYGGKYGVLLDVKRTVPVQVFTPRNIISFSSSRKYYEPPHKLHVKFIDPDSEWNQFEAIVYQDGYNENNAETYEDLETFACTNYEQAWRFGRYMMAQAKLRQENITIEVDFENLICTRGDYVLFVHDVMKVGGRPSRVTNLVGNVVTIDEEIVYNPLLTYGYTFRSNATGLIKTGSLVVNSTFTATLTGDLPTIGDLFVYGETTKITYDCIVKAISPVDDLRATITLVEKADAVYDAENSMPLPPYEPSIAVDTSTDMYIPPKVEDLTELENSWRCTGVGYEYYVDISWTMPEASIYSTFEVYANTELIDYTNTLSYKYIVPDELVGTDIEIRVLAVSQSGKKIALGEADSLIVTPLSKVTPPSDVDALYLNVTGEVLQLEWPLVSDCDVEFYIIRYTPRLDAMWENSIPLSYAPRNISMTSVQARTGSYFIKAIDFAGNLSTNAAKAITSIPELFNLNVIEETNDFPTLSGAKDRVVDDGGLLRLQSKVEGGVDTNEYHSEGYYYYDTLLDLGDIYSVRLQSNIEAEGYSADDLMSNWETLEEVLALSNSKFSEWDVEAYVRSRDSYDVIASWTTLEEVEYMFQGSEDDWGPWRKFTIGDFTGRIFQFRLKLVSFKPSVSPKVYDGIIKADMPDRIDSFVNITCPAIGKVITYTPPFKGPSPSPAIQITQDDATQGDYYKITNKTLNGFTIQFFDKDNIAVERTFDTMIRGYGRKASNSI